MKQKIIGVISIIILTFFSYFVVRNILKWSPYVFQKQSLLTKTTPTPIPYKEITIPYLRSRIYKSTLGNLSEVYDYQNYKGYLTNYISDGLKINGLLTIPKGEKPAKGWPAIVFVHGYIPPTQYQTLEKYVDYVDYLARNGFVVFKIDLRGHGESDGKPGGGYFGSDYVVDTLNAYAALQSADFINQKSIGLWGHSMAGNTVLRSMAINTNIPAIVIWAGAVYSYTDQAKYGIQDASYQRLNQTNSFSSGRPQQGVLGTYGRPAEGNNFWKLVAPTTYLNDIRGAIQIHHANDDETVNIGYSEDLISLLDKTKIPHEFYTYQTGGHNVYEPSFSLAIERTLIFYEKYLNQ